MVKPRHHRLRELTTLLSENMDRVQILDLIALEGVLALDAHVAVTSLLTDDGAQFQPLRPMAHPAVGSAANVIDAWQTFAADTEFPIADAVRTQTLVVLESREQRDARYPHLANREEPSNAWIVSPIVLPARALGAIELRLPHSRHVSEEDRAYVTTLTDLCAQALDRARLAEMLRVETKQRKELEESLQGITSRSETLRLEFQRLRQDYDQLRAEHQRLVTDRARGSMTKAEVEERDLWRKIFVRDMLASATAGKLRLCLSSDDLPPPLMPFGGDPIDLALPGGVRTLRHRALDAAKALGLNEAREYDLEVAVGEVGTNALAHAGGGIGTVTMDPDKRIQVRISDHGAGIALEDLPKATLARGYSTRATLGHGMKIVLQTTDHVSLLTNSTGTTVVLEQEKAPEEASSFPDFG